MNTPKSLSAAALVLGLLGVSLHGQQPAEQQGPEAFRFKSGVELINVTATVSDMSGHFVSGLTQNDFIVYEDDQREGGSKPHPRERGARVCHRHRLRKRRPAASAVRSLPAAGACAAAVS